MKTLTAVCHQRLARRLVGGLLLILSFSLVGQADEYPSARGFVNDFAGIIDSEAASQMEAMLRQLRDRAGIEIAVVTVPSLNGRPIEDYSIELARRWGVGGKEENSGLLLLIAPNERKYRIEVGYGLEGDIPDGLAGEIGRRMRPYFRRQEYSQGILLAVNSIVATLAEKRNLRIEGSDPALAYHEPPRRERGSSGFGILLLLVIIIVVIAISASDAGRRGGPGRRRRYGRASDWLWYPILFGGGGSGGFGGYRGGRSSWGGFGGGGGGGGFGGFGGGSFGGGGASGDW
ncbi:MAG: TPM domain-containing protein [Acidobacteria bacterium]|nr:TPM domain-containing protein [Acidobacteriota bacterium]